jgi:hypothetical protein
MIVLSLSLSSYSGAAALAASEVGDATPVVSATGGASELPPAKGHPNARLKLSFEGFSIGTTLGTTVRLAGLHLEAYPLSRPWLRGGVGLTGGAGNAKLDDARANLVYGLLGVSVGAQYPARITPFVEGHLSGGFMTATLDRAAVINGVAIDSASGTTWLVTRGLDAGVEVYTLGRAYVSTAIGWMRTTWASPAYDTSMPNTSGSFRIVSVTGDSLLWKVGLGI